MTEPVNFIHFGGVAIPEKDIDTKAYDAKTGRFIITFKNGVKAKYHEQTYDGARLFSIGTKTNSTTTGAFHIMGLSIEGTDKLDEVTLEECSYSHVATYSGNSRDHVTFSGGHDNFHWHGKNEDLTTYTKQKYFK